MKNIFLKIKDSVVKAFSEPKKLIPTFILAAIWIIIPIITNFIPRANTPFIRLISTITYARGGVNCGLFGLIGGVFGKAIFAGVVNGLVISLCAKKNPFEGAMQKLTSIFKDAKRAINPLLVGSGVGLILYFIFNSSASTQNIAIAIAGIVATLTALSKQNGLAFAGAFWIAKKLSKGKAPSRIYVSRLLAGLMAGFALSLVMTYIAGSILILLLGIALLIAGSLNTKKVKQIATAIFVFGIITLGASGEMFATSLPDGFTDPHVVEGLDFGSIYTSDPADEGYSDPAKLDGVCLIPKNIITNSVDFMSPKQFAGRHLVGVGDISLTFDSNDIIVRRGAKNGEYTISGGRSITGSDRLREGSYTLEYTYEFTIKNIKMDKESIIADYEGTENIKWWSDDPEYPADERTIKISGRSDDDECRWHTRDGAYELELRTPGADREDEKGLSMVFEIAGVITNGKVASVVAKPDKDNKPTSNNYSDLDKHDVAVVGTAILTTLAGVVGGAVASGAGSATGSILNNMEFEFGEEEENIEKDAEGDIYVNDGTGRKTLYKSNGDGTYKNMITGDNYTEAEIKEHANYLSRNAEYFKDANAKNKKAKEEQRADSRKVSELGKEIDKKVKAEEAKRKQEEAHEEYKEKVSEKYGTTDEKEIKKEILKNRNEEYEKQGEELARADMAEGYEKSAQKIETTADVIVGVAGELDTTGVGKVVKDSYVAAKAVAVNTAQVVTGEKDVVGAVASAMTDTGVGIAQNHSTSYTAKLLTNSSGDAIKTAVDGIAKGQSTEEIRKNAKSSAMSGAINATVDVGFDKATGKAIKGMKDANKKVGKVFGETVTKETATNSAKSAVNDATKNALKKEE